MKTKIIVLSKGMNNPKTRLSNLFSYKERIELAHCMLTDVLTSLYLYREVVTVLTSDFFVMQYVLQNGFNTHFDHYHDINRSLTEFTSFRLSKEIDAVLVLPADIPLIGSEELEMILNIEGYDVVIVPSIDNGTNGMLTRPPGVLGYHYGLRSAEKYHQQAILSKVPLLEINLQNMRDIDNITDIEWLINQYNNGKKSISFLHNIETIQRLKVYKNQFLTLS